MCEMLRSRIAASSVDFPTTELVAPESTMARGNGVELEEEYVKKVGLSVFCGWRPWELLYDL